MLSRGWFNEPEAVGEHVWAWRLAKREARNAIDVNTSLEISHSRASAVWWTPKNIWPPRNRRCCSSFYCRSFKDSLFLFFFLASFAFREFYDLGIPLWFLFSFRFFFSFFSFPSVSISVRLALWNILFGIEV